MERKRSDATDQLTLTRPQSSGLGSFRAISVIGAVAILSGYLMPWLSMTRPQGTCPLLVRSVVVSEDSVQRDADAHVEKTATSMGTEVDARIGHFEVPTSLSIMTAVL